MPTEVADPALAEVMDVALHAAEGVVERVTEVDARQRGIIGLTGIEAFRELRSLRVDDNSIEDLAPVAQLPRLAGLSADDNQIEDLSPLSSLDATT